MADGDLPIDVRHLPYMPLQIERLKRSKAWLRCKRRPELAFYILNLWMRAWHEVPAGSIEDDDDVLADAAMCPPEKWDEIKALVLTGWHLEDGRLYHDTVTELAAEAATKIQANQARTAAARRARDAARQRPKPAEDPAAKARPTKGNDPACSVTDTVTTAVTKPEEKRREGKGRESNKRAASPTTPRDEAAAALSELDLRKAAGLENIADAPALSALEPIHALLAEGIGRETILAAIRGMPAKRRMKARSWDYFIGAIRDAARTDTPPSSGAKAPGVWILADSDEGRAHSAYNQSRGEPPPYWIRSGRQNALGRTMPTRWPPGHEAAETTTTGATR